MATGDVTIAWNTLAAVAFTSGGPDTGITNGSFCTLSDEIDTDASAAQKVLDILVSGKAEETAGAPTTNSHVAIWAAVPADGTNYPASTQNYVLVGVIWVPTQSVQAYSAQFSLAAAFGGVLPEKFKLAIENRTGQTLTSGSSQNGLYIQRVYANVASA